ncbi:MAG: Asp23/Gls24 family envelope stress response protein [Proteobacteria bacterium]|nr:Asp23/Gls24 family envelope stress response protein [Pseudomonadota bacterium]
MSEQDTKNPSGIAGSIRLDPTVVARIASLAAKDIKGIYSVGKTSLLSFGDDPTRGVAAEIGEKQVAVDLDVVIEYGYDLRQVATELRSRTANELEKMTGREVVEINIHVVDIRLPEELQDKKKPRVI